MYLQDKKGEKFTFVRCAMRSGTKEYRPQAQQINHAEISPPDTSQLEYKRKSSSCIILRSGYRPEFGWSSFARRAEIGMQESILQTGAKLRLS